MVRTVILYGGALAILIAILRTIEYRFLVHDLSLELYVGLIAMVFTALGIWAGLRLTRRTTATGGPFVPNESALKAMGISSRELEVLELMGKGLSNQEIADALFVSLNTVKTHSSNIFLKLDVSRRTQAIRKAKELCLIR